MSTIRSLLTLSLAASALGCGKDDDNGDSSSSSSSSTTGTAWIVGDDAEMLRISQEGDASPYDIEADADFLAIACQGTATAWVTGAAGTVMVTHDAGATWDRVDVGTTAALTAVAVAEHGGSVWVAGEDGTLIASHDEGSTWSSISGPALDWSGVATDREGTSIVLVALDGSIWRGGDAISQVHATGGEVLHGVALDAQGQVAAAVGDLGTVLVSHDGGASFSSVAVPTTRDLYAVRVIEHGEIVAVGEAGVIVRVDESGATADEQLDPALSLRALHLRATGLGQAVGDAGIVLLTNDAGLSWEPVDLDTEVTLRGVDDFHVGPHA
jgi:photosystem II stability/assembly factor-like uncharacterized protein